MLRSLINSARGRSALAARHDDPGHPPELSGYGSAVTASVRPADSPPPAAPHRASPGLPPVTASVANIRPRRCCLYCGHSLYAAPRVRRMRCPRCFQELPVQDVCLEGPVTVQRVITAGRIIVAAGAQVRADLVACTIDVAGDVLGDLLASQLCRLQATARVAGRVICRQLDVESGAHLQAAVELIGEAGTPSHAVAAG